MDITVEKNNNQNAKIGLERTPNCHHQTSTNNKLHQTICSRSKNNNQNAKIGLERT